jgi:HicB family
MDLSKYVTQLREDLASAAAAGDEQTQRTAALLGAAVEPAARLALMNALSDLAAEVTAALPDRVVEVRLDGRDVRVSVSDDGHAAEPEQGGWGGFGAGGFGGDAGDISRITLRLVEQIKGQAEQAAAAQGVSLNSWVAQAVQGALAGRQSRPGRDQHGKRGRDGRRIQGWVQG